MIDLKQEILKRQQNNDEKVELYNSVVNEYIPQIYNICDSNNLKFEYDLDKYGLTIFKIYSRNEKIKYYFTYNIVKKDLRINRYDDKEVIRIIESQLKTFILQVVKKEDVRIEDKPFRGLRAKTGVIDESCNIDKEQLKEVVDKFDKPNKNNIYLTQKERNVIRCDIERTLHKFETEVDNTLRNNEFQLAKVNHNVVDACRSILNKLEVADNEESKTYDYYLTIDLVRDGNNKAILFKRYENSLKIEKFISFYEKDSTNMVRKFLDEIKELNCAILIPNVAFGGLIIDYFKAEGFEDIIEISSKDIHRAMSINNSFIGSNCDELYIRILLYTTNKLGFKI